MDDANISSGEYRYRDAWLARSEAEAGKRKEPEERQQCGNKQLGIAGRRPITEEHVSHGRREQHEYRRKDPPKCRLVISESHHAGTIKPFSTGVTL